MLKGAFVGGALAFSACFAAYGLKVALVGLVVGVALGVGVAEITG